MVQEKVALWTAHQKWITLFQFGYLLLSSPECFGKNFWFCFNVMVEAKKTFRM